ncbi:methionyl-tRNA formyltransferase [Halobacterium salinarum]|uniref:Formyl transferase n=1 Tax=Halobacterium salinarum (strain ATCC 33171 / DSM 3754 / JCM 8978 / NBRC 102687 / NCIMB 764 / 91-R6) TaxID=2597657 RepID=A0A4D6GQP7_HALS9|nr:formyltransferase family protein [Halobacterium salinarum]QCC44004.1 formyltransferase domain protein [Halobacterium salinarum]TYO76950.1 Formyl transferase [Halobacterium salinarum DSM 3754]
MVSVALFGSRPLSRSCLELLHEESEISVEAVVTHPEGHDGWWDGALRSKAEEYGYPVIEENEVFECELDYIISVLYYEILDAELLEHPKQGGLNLHQAELPRYRGSNTFSHAIMNARDDDYWKYGTTLHFMSEEVDEGDIVARKFVDITEEDTSKSLYKKAEQASIELFEEQLPNIISGEVQSMRTPQSEFDEKTYFYNKTSLDGEKWIPLEQLVNDGSLEVYDMIRALDFPPFEPAYTKIDGKKVYLTKTSYEDLPVATPEGRENNGGSVLSQ